MIDTRNFTWSDCEIRIAGRLITGITAAKFTTKQEKEFQYGKGSKPLAIQRGNESIEGSVTLYQYEMEKLQDAAPGGDLLKMDNLSIQVAYANDQGGLVRYSLSGVEFSEIPQSIEQNAKNMTVEIPFMALSVTRQ